MIVLCCDHAGFEYKENIKKFLESKKLDYIDVGAFEYNEKDDYPDYVIPACDIVKSSKKNIGIFVCGSGVGVNMVANRFVGIRSVLGYNTEIVELARLHEDANVVCFGARLTSFKKVKDMINVMLNTKFLGETRHKRRIKKYN